MAHERCRMDPADRVRFAYGEMPTEEAAAFAGHLAACEPCRREVQQLEQAAALCAQVRAADLPEPVWTRGPEFLSAAPRRRFFSRPWFWVPAAAAGAAAFVLLWIFLAAAPPTHKAPQAPEQPGPPDRVATGPGDVAQPPPVHSLAIEGLRTQGRASLRRDADGTEQTLAAQTAIRPGDRLVTGGNGRIRFGLDDGSRIQLLGASVLQIDHLGTAGDALRLKRGTVVCQVTPRQGRRSFAIETPRGRVSVRGTRFAVRLDADGALQVGVTEGRVELALPDAQDGPISVGAGQRIRLAAGARRPVRKALDEPLLAWLAPDGRDDRRRDPAGQPVKTPARPKRDPRPAPDRDAQVGPKPDRPPVRPPDDESLEALVARLHQDTGWIFDDLRADMERGRHEQVLRKLKNYLQDPTSPRRGEATFLMAVCQEKLARYQQAARSYRAYLTGFPTGTWRVEARRALRRIRAHL